MQSLRCPITNEIFLKPVMASDGHVYEESAIKEWLKNNETSPKTREIISHCLQKVLLVEQIVESYLKEHPEMKAEQFTPSPYSELSIILERQDYAKLMQIKSFGFYNLFHKWEEFFKFSSEKIQKHVIDHWENYEEKCNNWNITLFNLVCGNHNLEIIKYIIDKGVNLNNKIYRPDHHNLHERSINEYTSLILACEHEEEEKVLLLIDSGADLEESDKNGYRPIHHACMNGNMKIFLYLLAKGVDLNSITKTNFRPIDIAFYHKNFEISKILLKEWRGNLELEDKYGSRLIHRACMCSNLEIIKILVEKGVDLEAENCDKDRPIHFACIHQKLDVIQYLAEKGVDLEAEDEDGERPIHLACRHQKLDVIQYLAEKGVDLEAEDENRQRPIHYACRDGGYPVIKYLTEKGVNLEAEDEEGLKPIHYACKYRHFKDIKYLAEQGVDLESKTYVFNMKPIHYACESQSLRTIQFLVNKGVDYRSPGFSGAPIFIAYHRNNESKTFRFLRNKIVRNNDLPNFENRCRKNCRYEMPID